MTPRRAIPAVLFALLCLPSVGLGEGGSPMGDKPKIPVKARPVEKPPVIATCCFDRNLKDVQRDVRKQAESIKRCYERGLKSAGPGLKGRVVLSWVIEPDGSVSKVEIDETTLGEPQIEACFVSAVKKWHFEAGEEPCDVTFPFVFVPGE